MKTYSEFELVFDDDREAGYRFSQPVGPDTLHETVVMAPIFINYGRLMSIADRDGVSGSAVARAVFDQEVQGLEEEYGEV